MITDITYCDWEGCSRISCPRCVLNLYNEDGTLKITEPDHISVSSFWECKWYGDTRGCIVPMSEVK